MFRTLLCSYGLEKRITQWLGKSLTCVCWIVNFRTYWTTNLVGFPEANNKTTAVKTQAATTKAKAICSTEEKWRWKILKRQVNNIATYLKNKDSIVWLRILASIELLLQRFVLRTEKRFAGSARYPTLVMIYQGAICRTRLEKSQPLDSAIVHQPQLEKLDRSLPV